MICRVLRLRTYTGVFTLHTKTKSKPLVESPFMPNFKIIEQADFDEAQRMLTANRKHPNARRPTRCGTMLLTGFSYCGKCGCKLAGSMAHFILSEKHKPPEERKRYPMYRCRSYEMPKGDRSGCKPSMWSAQRIEEVVIRDAKEFLLTVDKEKLMQSYEEKSKNELGEILKRFEQASAAVDKKEREIRKLKEEVVKTLLGESTYSPGLLNELIKVKETELAEILNKQDEARDEMFRIEQELAVQKSVCDEIINWAARFDAQDVLDKKAMLLNVIDRIDVYGDRLDIRYKIRLEEAAAQSLLSISGAEDAENGGNPPETALTTDNTALSSAFLCAKRCASPKRNPGPSAPISGGPTKRR